jgi:hypothetical protein
MLLCRPLAAILFALLTSITVAVAQAPTNNWFEWLSDWVVDAIPIGIGLSGNFDSDGIEDTVDPTPAGSCATDAENDADGTVEVITPSENLTSLINSDGDSTADKYCILSNTKTITTELLPDAGDIYVGRISKSEPMTAITTAGDLGNTHETYGGVDNIFQIGDSQDGVTFRGMDISKAQAYKVDTVTRCSPNCGRGISLGDDATVIDSRIHHNENQGIGGTHNGTLTVRDSEIHDNGYGDDGAYYAQDDLETAAGIKTADSNSVVPGHHSVTDSHLHRNAWSAVWCDLNCAPSYTIQGNTMENNGRVAIHVEVSGGVSTSSRFNISGNRLRENANCTVIGYAECWGHQAAIILVEAQWVDVLNNEYGGNAINSTAYSDNRTNLAVDAFEDHRESPNGQGLNNITVNESISNLSGDKVYCQTDNVVNVTCSPNTTP